MECGPLVWEFRVTLGHCSSFYITRPPSSYCATSTFLRSTFHRSSTLARDCGTFPVVAMFGQLWCQLTACCLLLRASVYGAASPLVLDLVTEQRSKSDQGHKLARRAGSIPVNLDDDVLVYTANVSIGAPPQQVRFSIYTGSGDTLVTASSNAICNGTVCDDQGTYNANSSSTYHYLSSNFTSSFIDTTRSSGDYVTDTLRIGGAEITNLEFGVVYTGNLTGKSCNIEKSAVEQV